MMTRLRMRLTGGFRQTPKSSQFGRDKYRPAPARPATCQIRPPAMVLTAHDLFRKPVHACGHHMPNRKIDENGPLPYKPGNCPRWPGLTGPVHFGSKLALFRAGIAGFHLIYRRIAFGEPFGRRALRQRRTTREADLSTQQTGAQAPSRLSRPPRDHRRPQGSCRPPRARPQAFERLNGPYPRHLAMCRLKPWTG